MRNYFYLLVVLLSFYSCTPARQVTTSKPPRKQPEFLEDISIKPEIGVSEKITPTHKDVPGSVYSTDIEKCQYLQFKYAILMEEPVESVTNEKLISFLEDWYGIPYQYGGESRKGIDCSAFTSVMMDSVYGISLPRTAREQYARGERIKKTDLAQGDLVFFNTSGGISHVGVFLSNNKFVHASTSSGVMISDLDDAYFKRRYVGAARPLSH